MNASADVAATTAPACRVCGSRETTFALEAELPFKDGVRRYFTCDDCGTLLDASGVGGTYDGGPSDTELTDREPNVKFFIEVGAGFDSFAVFLELLRQALGSRSDARTIHLLDVGASFGFLVAMARDLGWDAIGVEPSYYGRIGSRVLGVPVRSAYLEDAGLQDGSFECIVSSEVVEHVSDPRGFVSLLSRHLSPDGILLLTTPNGEVLRGGASSEAEWYDGLSPGQHLNLLSPRALVGLLAECGLHDVHVMETGGSSSRKHLYVLAGRQPGRLPAPDLAAARREAPALATRYLENVVLDGERNGRGEDPVYRGALFRLEQDAINRGQYARALPYVERIDRLLDGDGLDAAFLDSFAPGRFVDYVARVPAFLGLHYYLRGILELNHASDPAAAGRSFGISARLCRIEEGLGVFPRFGWSERARFHEGLALSVAGRPGEAAAAFDDLLRHRDRVPGELLDRLFRMKLVAFAGSGEYQAIRRFLEDVVLQGSTSRPGESGNPAPREMGEALSAIREMAECYRTDRSALLRMNRVFDVLVRLRRRVGDAFPRMRGKAVK